MLKIALTDVKEDDFASPKKTFSLTMRGISAALAKRDEKKRQAPVDIEHCVLAPGKKNFPYHCHAAEWEIYYALKGQARMRTEAGIEDFKAGETAICHPATRIKSSTRAPTTLNIWSSPTTRLLTPIITRTATRSLYRVCSEPTKRWVKTRAGPLLKKAQKPIIGTVKNERLWIPPARSMTPNYGRATAIAAIGQVTSTAPVAAAAPAAAVTPSLRLATLSMIRLLQGCWT